MEDEYMKIPVMYQKVEEKKKLRLSFRWPFIRVEKVRTVKYSSKSRDGYEICPIFKEDDNNLNDK